MSCFQLFVPKPPARGFRPGRDVKQRYCRWQRQGKSELFHSGSWQCPETRVIDIEFTAGNNKVSE
jgi:hypothetical protein